ncbi:uncharacterized protein LOC144093148 [Stigmatopora argus]
MPFWQSLLVESHHEEALVKTPEKDVAQNVLDQTRSARQTAAGSLSVVTVASPRSSRPPPKLALRPPRDQRFYRPVDCWTSVNATQLNHRLSPCRPTRTTKMKVSCHILDHTACRSEAKPAPKKSSIGKHTFVLSSGYTFLDQRKPFLNSKEIGMEHLLWCENSLLISPIAHLDQHLTAIP